MAAHYCINCPQCKSGCSICRRCACTPEQLDAWMKPFDAVQYLTVTPLVLSENTEPAEEVEQQPETD